MPRIRRETAARIIDEIPNGQAFKVTFTKRTDGTTRTMICQKGVKEHLKGGEKAYDSAEHGLVTVWSQDAGGYRSFGLAQLRELVWGGETYEVI